MARRALRFVLLFSLAVTWPAATNRATAPAHYAGWAVEAYPEASGTEMEAIVRRLVDHGANVVWIGHNNPGEVDADKVEPGLSYAVYGAYADPADSRHADAIVAAQRRMLDACRAVGVRAVLERWDHCDGEVFNIGTEATITTGEGMRIVEEIIGRPARIAAKPRREGDQLKTQANIDKARRLLDYNPSTTPREGLARQVAWFKEFVWGQIEI